MKKLFFLLIVSFSFSQDSEKIGVIKIFDSKKNIVYSNIYPNKLYPNTEYEIELDSLIESISDKNKQTILDWGISGLRANVEDCYTSFYENFYNDFVKRVSKEELNEKISSRSSKEVYLDKTLDFSDGYLGLTSQPYKEEFYRLFKVLMVSNLEELVSCSAYDISSYIKDNAVSQEMGWPASDFFSYNNTGQRLLSALTLFNFTNEATFQMLDIIMQRNHDFFKFE